MMRIFRGVCISGLVLLVFTSCKDQQAQAKLTKLEARQETLVRENAEQRAQQNKLVEQSTQLQKTIEAGQAKQDTRFSELEQRIAELSKATATPNNINLEQAIEGTINVSVLTDPKIRALACPLLAQLGGPAAEARLVEMVRTDRDAQVNSAAIRALISLGSEQIIPLINEAIMTAQIPKQRQILSDYMVSHNDGRSLEPALTLLNRLASSSSYEDQSTRRNLYKVVAKVGKPTDFEKLKPLVLKEKDKSSIFDALLAINKDAFIPLLNESLLKAEKNDRRRLAEYILKYGDKTSRKPVLAALDSLILSTDYDSRYARRSLYRALAKLAMPDDFPVVKELVKLETSYKGDAMEVLVGIGSKNKSEIFAMLNKSNGKVRLSQEAFASLAAYADLRLTPYLMDSMENGNSYSSTDLFNLIGRLKDPLAAARLVAYQEKRRSSTVNTMLSKGYPGIVYDTKTKKATLVSEHTLTALIEKRTKTVAMLEAEERPQPEPKEN